MPTLTVLNRSGTFPSGTRLVLAIEALGVDIGHRCGGKARCTTCRVTFKRGEPARMSESEHAKLTEKGLLGEARLSCQITLDGDMTVTPLMTQESEGWSDTGPTPADSVEPEPVWTEAKVREGST